VKAGRSVYFTTLADLVGALARAERDGSQRWSPAPQAARQRLNPPDRLSSHDVIAGGCSSWKHEVR
jgi:hypothetical protein